MPVLTGPAGEGVLQR